MEIDIDRLHRAVLAPSSARGSGRTLAFLVYVMQAATLSKEKQNWIVVFRTMQEASRACDQAWRLICAAGPLGFFDSSCHRDWSQRNQYRFHVGQVLIEFRSASQCRQRPDADQLFVEDSRGLGDLDPQNPKIMVWRP